MSSDRNVQNIILITYLHSDQATYNQLNASNNKLDDGIT